MALVHGTSWGDDWGVLPRIRPNRHEASWGIEHDQIRKAHTMSYGRKTIVTLFAGAALLAGGATPANAATQNQDGLVNVAIGDITISDVNVGVAAQIVAQVCGVKVGPVAILGTAVDASGASETVCTTDAGGVTLTQN